MKKNLNKDIEELTFSYPNRQSMPIIQDSKLKERNNPLRNSDDLKASNISSEKKIIKLEYKIPRANRVKKNIPLPKSQTNLTNSKVDI